MGHGWSDGSVGRKVALPDDLGSIPSTHMTAYNGLWLPFQGIKHLFWPLWAQAHMQCTDIHENKLFIYIIFKYKLVPKAQTGLKLALIIEKIRTMD